MTGTIMATVAPDIRTKTLRTKPSTRRRLWRAGERMLKKLLSSIVAKAKMRDLRVVTRADNDFKLPWTPPLLPAYLEPVHEERRGTVGAIKDEVFSHGLYPAQKVEEVP